MQFQILITKATSPRGRRLLQALHGGARNITTRETDRYRADVDEVLVLYGMGGPDRLPVAQQHIAAGGRVVSWDAGYWDRRLSHAERKYRVSIDGLHPPRFVMRGPCPDSSRWKQSGLRINQGGDPDGPIILAGNGPKSNAIGAAGWAAKMSRKLRAAFPGRVIAYRPKPKRPIESGVDYDVLSRGDIDSALASASLVVCRHSNVAVDACRMGVPVVCEDGAAAVIYPNDLGQSGWQPDIATRKEFLHRLAWWQWSPNECASGKVWPWLTEVLSEPA